MSSSRSTVSIRTKRCKVLQKLVGYSQAAERPIVINADHQETGGLVTWQVIGEGADRLGKLIRVVRRDRALDAVGLESRRACLEVLRVKALRRYCISSTHGAGKS